MRRPNGVEFLPCPNPSSRGAEPSSFLQRPDRLLLKDRPPLTKAEVATFRPGRQRLGDEELTVFVVGWNYLKKG